MILTSIAPMGFQDYPPDKILPIVKKIGIKTVQVLREREIKYSASQVKKILDEYELIPASYHCDFGEHIDLANDSSISRESSVNNIASEAEFAEKLEIRDMVVHPCGVECENDAARDNFRRSLELLAKKMELFGVRCLIENIPAEYPYGSEPGILAADVSELQSPLLGLCFDTGHANMSASGVDAQIRDTKGFMHFMHTHDNDGTRDNHRLPFTSGIDWKSVSDALREIRYDGPLCLEVFETIDELEQKINTEWIEKLREFIHNSTKKEY